MSAYDWPKLEYFFPGCTHAAIDPHGMLVVMRCDAGEPFFHPSNRWIPGDKGVRKDYGLLGIAGPDFSPQSTLEANPNRRAEIEAARLKGTGASRVNRDGSNPNVAPMSTLHAPTLNEIADHPEKYGKRSIVDQPAVVDGSLARLDELGLPQEDAVRPVSTDHQSGLGYVSPAAQHTNVDPARPGGDVTGHVVASPNGQVVAFGDEAKDLAMELAIAAQAAAFKSGDQALYDKYKAKVDRLKELLG